LPVLLTLQVAVIQILSLFARQCDSSILKQAPNHSLKIMVWKMKKAWEFLSKTNGKGIEPQFYDKIFVLFQRLHNKESYNGTGNRSFYA